MLEMDKNKRGFRDTPNTAGAEADVLKSPPALYQKRESAFSQASQGSKQRVVSSGVYAKFSSVFWLFHGSEYTLASALVAGIREDRHLGGERPDNIENLTTRGLNIVDVSGSSKLSGLRRPELQPRRILALPAVPANHRLHELEAINDERQE